MKTDPDRQPEVPPAERFAYPSDADSSTGIGDPLDREARHPHSDHLSHGHAGHGGHRWMMLICCVPMVLIAVALVATGVAGSGALVSALLCVVMMGAMMFAMPGHHSPRR